LKFGRYAANHLQVFSGDGKGNFFFVPFSQSGVAVRGEVRGIKSSDEFLYVFEKGKGIHIYRNLSSKD
jgi:hypothetical protein